MFGTKKKEKVRPVTKRDIWKLFGFLLYHGLEYSRRRFKKCHNGNRYADTYSFYNESGCFTIYKSSERDGWDFYYAKKYSKDIKELLDEHLDIYSVEREMWEDYRNATDEAHEAAEKEVNGVSADEMFRLQWKAERVMLETLAEVINVQMEKQGSFFGVKANIKTDVELAYEKLKENPNIGTKITMISYDFIEIIFHEYLEIKGDDDILVINDSKWGELTHWHPNGADDMFEILTDIANGDTIFIENKCWFHPRRLFFIVQPWNLKTMDKETFRKKESKLLSKRYLRIYTGNEIIKRNGETK